MSCRLEAILLHFCNLNHFEIIFKITLKSLFGKKIKENLSWKQFCSTFATRNHFEIIFKITLEITFGTLCQITLKSLWL